MTGVHQFCKIGSYAMTSGCSCDQGYSATSWSPGTAHARSIISRNEAPWLVEGDHRLPAHGVQVLYRQGLTRSKRSRKWRPWTLPRTADPDRPLGRRARYYPLDELAQGRSRIGRGEASGRCWCRLDAVLQARYPMRFIGVGGEEMTAAGLSVFPHGKLSVMGIRGDVRCGAAASSAAGWLCLNSSGCGGRDRFPGFTLPIARRLHDRV